MSELRFKEGDKVEVFNSRKWQRGTVIHADPSDSEDPYTVLTDGDNDKGYYGEKEIHAVVPQISNGDFAYIPCCTPELVEKTTWIHQRSPVASKVRVVGYCPERDLYMVSLEAFPSLNFVAPSSYVFLRKQKAEDCARDIAFACVEADPVSDLDDLLDSMSPYRLECLARKLADRLEMSAGAEDE